MSTDGRGRNVWMSGELWDALEKQAVALERSVNWLIGRAVAEYVRKQEPKNGARKA